MEVVQELKAGQVTLVPVRYMSAKFLLTPRYTV